MRADRHCWEERKKCNVRLPQLSATELRLDGSEGRHRKWRGQLFGKEGKGTGVVSQRRKLPSLPSCPTEHLGRCEHTKSRCPKMARRAVPGKEQLWRGCSSQTLHQVRNHVVPSSQTRLRMATIHQRIMLPEFSMY